MQKINYLGKNGTKRLKENLIYYVETNRCDVITADDINQWYNEIFYTKYVKIPKGTSMSIHNGTFGFSATSDISYTSDLEVSAVVYNGCLLHPDSGIDYGIGGSSHSKNTFKTKGITLLNDSGKLRVWLPTDGEDFDSIEDNTTTQIGLYHDIFIYYTIPRESDKQTYTYVVSVSENKLQTPNQYGFELPFGFAYPKPYTIISVYDDKGNSSYKCSQYTTILDGEEIVYLLIIPESSSSIPTQFLVKLKHTEAQWRGDL